MIFPKVTYNLKKYKYLTGGTNLKVMDSTNGLYKDSIIWLRKRSFLTLLHELIHHFFRSIGNYSGSTRLFFDFLNQFYESVWGIVRYSDWRRNHRLAFKDIRISWNDWLDWVLCR